MWFSIPFTLATSLGLASVALDLPITKEEAGAGLVPPAVAVYILGKSGAVWITIMLVSGAAPCGVRGSVAGGRANQASRPRQQPADTPTHADWLRARNLPSCLPTCPRACQPAPAPYPMPRQFMAVTSTGSAELIGVSSLVSYDIYR